MNFFLAAGAALSKVPRQVWMALAAILLVMGLFYSYGKYVEGKTETRIEDKYQEAYEKAVEARMGEVEDRLRVGIASNEKLRQKSIQAERKASEYAKELEQVENELESIKNKDIACRDIPYEYHSLLKSLLPD